MLVLVSPSLEHQYHQYQLSRRGLLSLLPLTWKVTRARAFPCLRGKQTEELQRMRIVGGPLPSPLCSSPIADCIKSSQTQWLNTYSLAVVLEAAVCNQYPRAKVKVLQGCSVSRGQIRFLLHCCLGYIPWIPCILGLRTPLPPLPKARRGASPNLHFCHHMALLSDQVLPCPSFKDPVSTSSPPRKIWDGLPTPKSFS